ncbi:copper resistance protein NlpE N-terminal domain-containing protein [Methylophilus medardicus]|uniref:Copper resistance protein NlpE n=1 Tax=Methylophilus medardicus TaxID=2588534 RepID=A0A5B8CT69_9PROT|nr:copper resistance protein NlpE N-terminal domain-containing protein [Methylophilus medardicus]QDC44095.1 copper resistance protein NlpE [Methylophilus medardicus]QDC49102.1 copper resistance protein NlpE [Methylophilus medardicus]QDC52807.1 copper resistance protein NlpE [Methylophilus medardicus]
MQYSLIKTVVRCLACLMAMAGVHVATQASPHASSSGDEAQVLVQGVLEKRTISSWQYGTHQLTGDFFQAEATAMAPRKVFALKSEQINLDPFLGQEVAITGKAIAGYPVDGGPDFIEVIAVAMSQKQASGRQQSWATPQDWAGTYHGRLPCDNCIAIEAKLALNHQGYYQLKQTQLTDDGKQTTRQSRGKYHLNVANGELWLQHLKAPLHFRRQADRLILLDPQGNPKGNPQQDFLQKF